MVLFFCLTNRSKQVKINNSFQQWNIVARAGSALHYFFTLLCKWMQNHVVEQSSHHILWWLILRLLHVNDCSSWYFRDIATFNTRCNSHHLMLKTSKLLRSLTGGEWGFRTRRPMTVVPLNWWARSNTYSIKKWMIHINYLCTSVMSGLFMSEHTLRGRVFELTNVAGCPAFLPCSLLSLSPTPQDELKPWLSVRVF